MLPDGAYSVACGSTMEIVIAGRAASTGPISWTEVSFQPAWVFSQKIAAVTN